MLIITADASDFASTNSDYEFFSGLEVVFPGDEGSISTSDCTSTSIFIYDDFINEANQVFVVYIRLSRLLTPVTMMQDFITVSPNASLVWILDDDRKFSHLA